MLKLDHLAIVCADLDVGCRWLEAALGVHLQAGGHHARFGTHNRLLGLEDGLYLEVIAPDPTAKIEGPRWFGLDDAPEIPILGNWICQADELSAFQNVAGPEVPLERGALKWRITVPEDGSLPFGGAFPTLIKWGAGVVHPAQSLMPTGVRLTGLTVTSPDAEQMSALCGQIDSRVMFKTGNQLCINAAFETPNGERVL